MTKADYEVVEHLICLHNASPKDKIMMGDIINRYINKDYKWCKTCDSAVRLAYKVFRNWTIKTRVNETNYMFIPQLKKDK